MGSNGAAQQQQEFQQAFISRERQERIRSGKVACALVMVLMPAGVILDLFMYPDRVREFFQLRLICSGLAVAWWALHGTSFGLRHYRLLGVPIAILPGFFISWMIFVTEGPVSPYYAGLILVLLAVTAVVHWSTAESLLALAVLYFMYFIACATWPIAEEQGIFFNNVYFLVLTGIIVISNEHPRLFVVTVGFDWSKAFSKKSYGRVELGLTIHICDAFVAVAIQLWYKPG